MKSINNHNQIKSATTTTSSDHGNALNLKTVKTTSDAPERTRPRIFGIKEAPTYYPTEEEFKEPIKYIQQITPEAEKFGIIKIVPPKSYNPAFCLNTEEFRFRTRIQKLNSMEGETRANVNYLEQLYKFHRLHGHPVNKVPQLDKRPIDLFKLKKEVAQRGGYQMVTQQKKWAEIGRILGYTRKQCTSMSNALKSAYNKVILPYEVWLAQHKQDSEQSSSLSSSSSSPPSNVGMRRQPSDKEEQEEAESPGNGGQACEICNSGENEEEILLCDGCDRGYHMYCLSPPLNTVPKSDWYCFKCLTAAGGDYGFEDGEEYTLNSFQKVCDKFKSEWFGPKGQYPTSEEDCEDEFWRLVENPHETCEVEYGADLHSTQHGSGFAPLERKPDGRYVNEPWNLNMIPILPQSLFTHIKTDISGMMVPWLYIGMCFSAFCWHNEDHYTYSINYMHWGETKTWYGVPGCDTAKFEKTMKAAVPELFEQQPDLLFQLVTMLSPGRLLKDNVDVYAVDQRPGQFVVTFPKAYHSGFNHGFNFCEAVNFAPMEWVDFGLECVKRYKQYRRQPCFSHDELLVTAMREDRSVETSTWLKDALIDMHQREMTMRSKLLKKYPKIHQVLEDIELSEDQQQCVFCNTYTYLSYITCECTSRVSCLDHLTDLCTCDPSKKTLNLRFSECQLNEMIQATASRACAPSAWSDKVRETLSAQSAPSLKTLRQFATEAEKLSVPVEEARWVREYVTQVTNWLEEANKYIIRKHQPRRRDSSAIKLYTGEKYNAITKLLEQVSKMSFDAPEISMLEETFKNLTDAKDTATRVLNGDQTIVTSKDYKDAFDFGTSLGADFPEMQQLELKIKRCEWNERAPLAITNPATEYNELKRLIEQAKECQVSETDPVYLSLVEKEKRGIEWIQEAEPFLKSTTTSNKTTKMITLQSIQDVLHAARQNDVPRVPHLYSAVHDLATRANETVKDVNMLLERARTASVLSEKPSSTDVQRVLKSIRTLPIYVEGTEKLQIEFDKVETWLNQVKKLFHMTSRTQQKNGLEPMLEDILENVETITDQDENNGDDDDNDKQNDVYCLCRTPESGLMIECDLCHEWYHGPCVKVSRREAKAQTSYVCPICDGSQAIPHATKERARLEDILQLLEEADNTLLFVSNVYTILADIAHRMQMFRSKVQAFCRSKTHLGVEDIDMIKQHLRELEGLEVVLQDETEFLRRKVQALAPVSRNPSSTTIVTTPTQISASASPVLQRVPSLTSSNWTATTNNNNGNVLPIETDAISQSVSSQQQQQTDNVYCICRQPASNSEMIGCDTCHDWFHIECVNLTPSMVSTIDRYVCPNCIANKRSSRPVIKLTIKPPTQPLSPSPAKQQKRKLTAITSASTTRYENGRTLKQQKQRPTINDDLIVLPSPPSGPLTTTTTTPQPSYHSHHQYSHHQSLAPSPQISDQRQQQQQQQQQSSTWLASSIPTSTSTTTMAEQ
ncbi:PLU-1-like protein-domain-containing protein [Circinella umbellata]|nr:PLU-1-like protein-domain-containing protein [Circinella umbellata]